MSKIFIWFLEWTWEWWQWRGTPHSSNLQHYLNLTMRLFSVVSRTLIGGAVGKFYSPSWLGKILLREKFYRRDIIVSLIPSSFVSLKLDKMFRETYEKSLISITLTLSYFKPENIKARLLASCYWKVCVHAFLKVGTRKSGQKCHILLYQWLYCQWGIEYTDCIYRRDKATPLNMGSILHMTLNCHYSQVYSSPE